MGKRTKSRWARREAPLLFLLFLTGCPAQDDGAAGRLETGGSGGEAGAGCGYADPAGEVGASVAAAGPLRVGALRLEPFEGCERFAIDLVTEEGEPAAAAGDVSMELLRELGVVRVHLRDVDGAEPAATDTAFQGSVVRRAYVVTSPDGASVWVDLHLAAPAEARVSLPEAARVAVDLWPGRPPLPAPPSFGARVVVLEPRTGAASYPLAVSGYSRTFEANVVARLERQGEEVLETFTTATGWLDAWGHFSLAIPEGPAGPVTLHVGEYSARDGEWEGVAIELEMR